MPSSPDARPRFVQVNNALRAERRPSPAVNRLHHTDVRTTPVKVINMWAFIILCAIVSASAEYPETFRMCCSKAANLIKVVDPVEGTSSVDYTCYNSASETAFSDNPPSTTFFVSQNVDEEFGMPIGCDLELITFDENVIQLSKNQDHCYGSLVLEVINGTAKPIIPKIVALACKDSDISGMPVKIQNIRKCCSPGQMYDTKTHQCRNSDENYDNHWFIKKLREYGEKVFLLETGLNCKTVEYDVQLKDEAFALTLDGSTLNILSRGGLDHILSPVGNWCVDREYTSKRLMARVCTQDCSLFDAYCFKKCCPIGQHYRPFHCGTTRSACVPNDGDETFLNLSHYLNPLQRDYGIGDTLGISTQIQCSKGKIVLNKTGADVHSLTKEGMLESSFGVKSGYCLETFDWSACGSKPDVTAVVCFEAVPAPVKNFKLSFVLICISCVCLALTLVVYCTIPEMRNLHGWTLICHVSTMLFAFSCLARVQHKYVANKNICAALGYGIYFGFVAAFVWLNVMCVDIWWTFGSVRTVQPLHKGRATRRRFMWYSLYAWGMAVSITIIMFILDKFPITSVLDANMGLTVCWFGSEQNSKDDWPHYIFFVIPMGIVTSINFVLWLLTARHCARVKSEVHRLQAGSVGDRAKRRFRVDKANLVLTGKLWIVMGAGWSSELISTLVEPNGWTVVVDTINELQGVFIFIILIFKPKLYYLIRKRLGLEKPDTQKNGQSSTARTSSTFISRTISTDERAIRVSVPNDNAKQL